MTIGRVLIGLVILAAVALGLNPTTDRTTWLLENAPVFVLLPLIIYVQPRVRFSNFALVVMAFHALVLMIGGHWGYAHVPYGNFATERNHFDRIGHFMQGFGPAVALLEVWLRFGPLKRGWALSLVVISMCLAFSALYEMIEWWAALLLGQNAEEFLGTQGDQWDTQWDMFMALIGATTALVISRWVPKRAPAVSSRAAVAR